MANYKVVEADALDASLVAIGDAIREKTNKPRALSLANMPDEIRSIETGGGSDDSFYNDFWDIFQENGERVDYNSAFKSYTGEKSENYKHHIFWNKSNFKPKYDIKPTLAYTMFGAFPNEASGGIDDLEAYLEELGIVLDFSNCTNVTDCFNSAWFSVLPVLDFSKASGNIQRTFRNNYYLHTIRKLIFSASSSFNSTFMGCSKLENIVFEGEIAKSIPINQSPKLSDASIQSLIDCLADLTDGTTQTLTLHADVKAKLTDAQIAIITNKNWTLA